MIYYVCIMNFSIFSPFAYSHLVVLPLGEYKLLINSSLTNTTICLPFNVSIPLGDYVLAKIIQFTQYYHLTYHKLK
jgi:hypothetical protein